MKYGVFSVSTPEYTPEETLKLLKDIGYDGIEWRVTNVPKEFPKDAPYAGRYWSCNHSTIDVDTVDEQAPMLAELGKKYGMECFSLSSYLHPSEKEKIEKVMKAAAIMGVPKIRVFQESYRATEEQRNYQLLMAETRAQLLALEPLCRKYNVKIILEMHHDTIVSGPSAAWNLLSGLDPACFGINIDPGNMVYEGFENYQKAFELIGPYIAHVHVKNAILLEDGRDDLGSKTFKRAWAPLWDGSADLREAFRILKKFGYNDSVCVEDFSDEQPTADKLKADLAYMKKLEANA